MITFEIGIGEDPGPAAVLEATLIVLGAAVELNVRWLRDHPEDRCLLYCENVEYDFANSIRLSNTIPIKTAPELLRTGRGLCIDFVALDIAARRSLGEQAYPIIDETEKDGLYHVLTGVNHAGNELVYDPSREISRHGRYFSGPPCNCPA
jgi:hypothetical protein